MCWWHQATPVGQDQDQEGKNKHRSWQGAASEGKSYPQNPKCTQSKGLHAEHPHPAQAHTAEPTWASHLKDPISRTISPQKCSCHWPRIASINSWLWQPDSIHSLSSKTSLPSRAVCQVGNSAPGKVKAAAAQREGRAAQLWRHRLLSAEAAWHSSSTISCNSTGSNQLMWS